MEDDTIHDLIRDIEEATGLPAKRRRETVKSSVEKLTSIAYERGLLPDELDRLIELITTSRHLDQASLGALVRNFYPVAKVSRDATLKVVGSLGNGLLKAPLPVQSLLLRWLIMVCHILEDPAVLSQAYSVLFNLIDSSTIRPQACQLLALITRRKHVRPYRIQDILRLSRQTAGDASLIGLLRVFKNYYPEIPMGDTMRVRATPFKHPDPQWRTRQRELQDNYSLQRQLGSQEPQNRLVAGRQEDAASHLAKGRRGPVIPPTHTLEATENSVTVEEISSVDVLVQNLEKVELPSQLVSVLADPFLQKLLLLRPDDEAHQRVSNWLLASVGDVVGGDADESLLLDMVEVIHDYALHFKTLPTLFVVFFKELLSVWNGVDRRDIVLDVLTYLPLIELEELYRSILQPLERAVLDSKLSSQLQILAFYRSLFRRWDILIRSAEDASALPTASIPNLINHVNVLALTLTQSSPQASTSLAILDFYETVVPLFETSSVRITIPPPLLVYLLHFSPSLAVVSRLYALLAAYKRAWEAAAAVVPGSSARRDAAQARARDVALLNGFIVDVVNAVWRVRAFAPPADSAAPAVPSCLVSPAVVAALRSYARSADDDSGAEASGKGELALESLFGLSHSPVFCLQAISSLRELEEAALELTGEGDGGDGGDGGDVLMARHPGPVTQRSLARLWSRGGLDLSWHAYRAGVLRYLEVKGFGGVSGLMYSTVKPLMEEKMSD